MAQVVEGDYVAFFILLFLYVTAVDSHHASFEQRGVAVLSRLEELIVSC